MFALLYDDYLVDSAVENIINEYFQNKEVDYISYGLQVQGLNSSKVYKSFQKKILKLILIMLVFSMFLIMLIKNLYLKISAI